MTPTARLCVVIAMVPTGRIVRARRLQAPRLPVDAGCRVCAQADGILAARLGEVPRRSSGLHRHLLGPWLHMMSPAAYRGDYDAWNGLSGKYLFFAARPLPLIELAQTEIREHGFRLARVKLDDLIGPDHVLYLYWHDGSRALELAERWASPGVAEGEEEGEIRYRHWKSEQATLRGRYSEQFLRNRADYLRRTAGLG